MMKANHMQHEELVAFLETDEGGAFMDSIDARWSEAIEPMRRAGFIIIESESSVMASTYAIAAKACGLDAAASMLQMNGVEVPIEGKQ